MLGEKDLVVLASLRENARESLTRLSRQTGVPVSTLYDKLQAFKRHVVQRFTVLLDVRKLGFTLRTVVLVKAEPGRKDELLREVRKQIWVNMVQRVNGEYDLLVEAFFREMRDVEAFREALVTHGAERVDVLYTVEEVLREHFFSSKELVPLYYADQPASF